MGLGEKILNRAERQFGKLAFPGILRWIAGFQLLVWILAMANPGYLEALVFDKDKIFAGEVWRMFSWLFIPRGRTFLVIITVLFTFFINDLIENEIGTFRLNAYVVGMFVCLMIPALSPPVQPDLLESDANGVLLCNDLCSSHVCSELRDHAHVHYSV